MYQVIFLRQYVDLETFKGKILKVLSSCEDKDTENKRGWIFECLVEVNENESDND